MKGFVDFIRERGVSGIAVGIILGAAVTKLVNSFVTDILNPALGIFLGFAKGLEKEFVQFGSIKITWGAFIVNLIDFLTIALVVYLLFKLLRIEKLEAKKDKK